jgi:hypothetical protein
LRGRSGIQSKKFWTPGQARGDIWLNVLCFGKSPDNAQVSTQCFANEGLKAFYALRLSLTSSGACPTRQGRSRAAVLRTLDGCGHRPGTEKTNCFEDLTQARIQLNGHSLGKGVSLRPECPCVRPLKSASVRIAAVLKPAKFVAALAPKPQTYNEKTRIPHTPRRNRQDSSNCWKVRPGVQQNEPERWPGGTATSGDRTGDTTWCAIVSSRRCLGG